MNAVIKVGGKQYYVTEGSEIFVEKLNAEAGDVVNFNQVLVLDNKVGSPYLTDVTVEGEVLKNGKAKKVGSFYSWSFNFYYDPRGNGMTIMYARQGWEEIYGMKLFASETLLTNILEPNVISAKLQGNLMIMP